MALLALTSMSARLELTLVRAMSVKIIVEALPVSANQAISSSTWPVDQTSRPSTLEISESLAD